MPPTPLRHFWAPTTKSDIFFGPKPTALDAYVLAFLQRVYELKHDELIPDVLVKWGEKFTQGKIWKKEIFRGRRFRLRLCRAQ